MLQQERNDAYERVFDAIVSEQRALSELYAPIQERLEAEGGTLNKLRFSISRLADTITWAGYAEENLLDRRREGPFRGRGALIERAERELRPCWEAGSANEVSTAMSTFIAAYHGDFLLHAPVSREQHEAFRTWLGRFAGWLFNTDHIVVRYGITYDGVDIENLSPGTRGIVLLLLYLALDDDDDRPLVIDQPEENLDPRSVFDELVPTFMAAKARRQVVMVTHNANLVINTNADQIIIADASPQPDGGAPSAYLPGGAGLTTPRFARRSVRFLRVGNVRSKNARGGCGYAWSVSTAKYRLDSRGFSGCGDRRRCTSGWCRQPALARRGYPCARRRAAGWWSARPARRRPSSGSGPSLPSRSTRAPRWFPASAVYGPLLVVVGRLGFPREHP